MASYEVIINQHQEGRIVIADSAKMALVQALAEAIQWVERGDWPEDACTIRVSVVRGVTRLDGLSKYGITLSGSPKNPVIENRSGRTIIAYVLRTADHNGHGPVYQQLLATSALPAGIRDGESVYVIGVAPINPAGPNRVRGAMSIGKRPIVSATLVSVIFGAGQFVGTVDEQRAFDQFQFVGTMDEQWAYGQFAKKPKAVTEIGNLAKTQAWEQIEALVKLLPNRHSCGPLTKKTIC